MHSQRQTVSPVITSTHRPLRQLAESPHPNEHGFGSHAGSTGGSVEVVGVPVVNSSSVVAKVEGSGSEVPFVVEVEAEVDVVVEPNAVALLSVSGPVVLVVVVFGVGPTGPQAAAKMRKREIRVNMRDFEGSTRRGSRHLSSADASLRGPWLPTADANSTSCRPFPRSTLYAVECSCGGAEPRRSTRPATGC